MGQGVELRLLRGEGEREETVGGLGGEVRAVTGI